MLMEFEGKFEAKMQEVTCQGHFLEKMLSNRMASGRKGFDRYLIPFGKLLLLFITSFLWPFLLLLEDLHGYLGKCES